MAEAHSIRLIKRRDIDLERWDHTVATDPGNHVYGLSWWLDITTHGKWDALVLGDYRAVLPLPLRHAYGPIKVISRPWFTQQSGPWGNFDNDDVGRLLSAMPWGVLRIDLPLRCGIDSRLIPENFEIKTRTNYELDLSREWGEISAGFRKTIKKNLRRLTLGQISEASVASVTSTYRDSVGEKAGLIEDHYQMIQALAKAAYDRNHGKCWQFTDENGDMLAVGFFPECKGRITNLFSASTPKGYAQEGMSRLLTGLMQANLGKGRVMDFEGSDLPGVAKYFRAFGPDKCPYVQISRSIW